MPPVTVSIAATNVKAYRDLAKKLRQAGRKDLRAKLRKKIADAGKPVVEDVRAAVRNVPVTARGGGRAQRRKYNVERASTARAKASAARRGSGLLETIAKATKLKVTAKGVKIVVNSAQLPPDQRTLPRHLDSAKGWEHPTFGDWNAKVRQKGRPYFGATIKKRAPAFRRAIVEAMDEIAREIDQ